MRDPIDVGVLGATGNVGTRLVRMLQDHPWFRLVEVGASERSAGARLGDLVASDEEGALPRDAADLVVKELDGPWRSPLLLSALPSGPAGPLERRLAAEGHLVVSNASAHRQDADVPLVIPEVNPDHLALVEHQEGPGGIVTNPNCVVAGLALALAPLHEAFEIEKVVVTTFQAISGAGKPGPSAADLLDNVLPFIRGEEEKIPLEVQKILGTVEEGTVLGAPIRLSATSTRVGVAHGHLASVSVAFRKGASPAAASEAMASYRGRVADDDLPLAPARPIEVLEEEDRPQPRLDRDRGRGMVVTVGRVRPCEVLDVKFFVLSHNLVRGAAGAALLNAELCHARGLTARLASPAPAPGS